LLLSRRNLIVGAFALFQLALLGVADPAILQGAAVPLRPVVGIDLR